MVTNMQEGQTLIDERIVSEREFHNKRFAHEVRQATHGFYRTVRPAFTDYESRQAELVRGKDVLEYGCSVGVHALRLANLTKSISGIDLSDVAIEQAVSAAAEGNVTNAVFQTMNAEEMTFPDGSFDFVFGSSILHHLNLEKAYASIARVLRPGGSALFLEPLGHNVLINSYRNRTPEFRTPDEHPLVKADIVLSEKYFARCDVRFYGLASLFAIPVLKTPLGGPALAAGHFLDRIVLKAPGIRWAAWFSVIEFYK